ncbi:MAG: TPM domain-containing protein [Chthoniobacterales bacterium]
MQAWSVRLGMTVALLFLLLVRLNAAEVIPPKPAGYFNDYAGVVSKEAALRFNEQLAQFERDTSNQVLVAIFRKMQSDSSIEDYAQRIAQAWGVGQKDRSQGNGVVLLAFIADRKMSIQVGYGLEGTLPDVVAFDIRSRHINPHFRNGDYAGGLAEGIDLICKAIRGEYKGDGKTNLESRSRGQTPGRFSWFAFLIFVFILIMIARSSRHSRRGGWGYSGTGGPFIGGWSSGGGGGWSSGSSSGGGFSGFSGGGGSFGGGGSSGSW